MDTISQRQARLLNERPRPIRDAAEQMTLVRGVIGSIVTSLAGFGIITATQQDALVGLLGTIPGIITMVTSLLVAFGVVRQAEPVVTPLADPRGSDMRPLAPAGSPGGPVWPRDRGGYSPPPVS